MGNKPHACFFTNFSCGLFGFDIEWQASNSSTQSTKGNRGIIGLKMVLQCSSGSKSPDGMVNV